MLYKEITLKLKGYSCCPAGNVYAVLPDKDPELPCCPTISGGGNTAIVL